MGMTEAPMAISRPLALEELDPLYVEAMKELNRFLGLPEDRDLPRPLREMIRPPKPPTIRYVKE